MKKLHLKTLLLSFLLVSGMISFSPMTKAASVVLESAPKNFTNNSSPLYGNISWDSSIGIGGVFSGSAIAGITNPITVAVDPSGDVYAIDGSKILKKYSNSTWSNFSPAPPALPNPKDMEIDPAGNIYIVDATDNNIKKYTKSSGTWSVIQNTASPLLSAPHSVALDSVGNIYVADTRIMKYDIGTGVWSQVVQAGTSNADTYAKGTGNYGVLAFDSSDNLYWTDNYSTSYRVHKRTPQGVYSFVGGFVPDYGIIAVDKKGDVYVGGSKIVKLVNGIWVDLALAGSTATTVNNPYAMALDADGNFYTVSVTGSFKFQKFISGTSIKMQVRTGDDASMLNAADWASVCEVKNNSDLNTCANGAVNSSVVDGKPFVQYQVTLSADVGLNTPILNSVKIETEKTYPTDFKASYLISSPFDANNPFNKVSTISWNASRGDAGSTDGQVGFQVRAAADTTALASAQWCGPNGVCSATPGGDGTDFYQANAGSTILGAYATQDANIPDKNKVFQYATFLRSTSGSNTSSQVPVLNSVTVGYTFNVPPTVSAAVVAPQKTDGTMEITYDINGTKGNDAGATVTQDSPWVLLAYRPDTSVSVQIDPGAAGTSIVLNKSASTPIPSSGQILVGNELMNFTGNSNDTGTSIQLDGLTRGYSFNGGASYLTTASSHIANTEVFFIAKNVTGAAGKIVTLNADGSVKSGNLITWNPNLANSEEKAFLGGKKLTNMTFKVVANDSDNFNPLNAVNPTSADKILDLQSPTILSITTDAEHTATGADKKYYNNSAQIPLYVKFSENINFDSTGGKEIVLNLNSGTCKITSSVSGTDTATCSYVPGESENTPVGENLKLVDPFVTTNGQIKDDFSNVVTSFVPAENLDAATNIMIDNIDPTANDLNNETVKAQFQNSSLSAQDTNGSGIATYVWSKVTGSGNLNFSAPSAPTTNISADADGEYDIKVVITDKAGNVTEKTMHLIWDTANPGNAGTPNVPSLTNDNTPTITWNKATDSLSGLAKYELQRKTGAGGTFSTITTINNPADVNQTYTETELTDETYFYQVITTDKAGNSSTSSVSGAMRIDTIAPKLLSFTSNKPNVTAESAYGVGEPIDIRAVYDEPLAAGSQITVQLENSATPAVDVVLSTIEGNVLTGSFTVQGPRKGYDGELNIRQVNVGSESAFDEAGNIQTTSSIASLTGGNIAENNNIFIDTGAPVLMNFTAKKMPSTTTGSFKEGETLRITALYSKPIVSGTITVHLNTANGADEGADMLLDNRSGATIYGDYTVQAGDNADNLEVFSITAQSATDIKGNPLSDTGTIAQYNANIDALNVGLPVEQQVPHPINISGIQIDTTVPVLGSPAISYLMVKTNVQAPLANISATDNFDLSDGTMQFSLNGGTSWCAGVPYVSSYAFDITSGLCGGSGVNEVKTVTVKFIDKAGNESAAANTTIEYDNSKPILQSIVAEQGSEIYGPGSQIKIIAQYNETLAAGSNLRILFNSGKELQLNTIENGSQLTAIYTVGVTGSLEDTNKLRAASIVSQSVSDTSDPTNTQDSTSLAGISENIDANGKVIVIDTTAPAGNITIDRSLGSGQIRINATDENGIDNMLVELRNMDATLSCGFTDTWAPYDSNQVTDINEGNFSAVKGCVKFKDKRGNVSDVVSTVTPETPTGIELDDVSNTNLTPAFLGSIFTWQKPTNFGDGNLFSQYEQLRCESSDGNDCVPELASPMVVTDINQNYFVNTALTPEKKYCYQARFKDQHGNFSKLSPITCAVSGQAPAVTDSQVNIISGQENDILITDITETSAKIVFSTRDTAHNNKPVLTKAIVQAYLDPQFTQLASTSAEESDYSVTHIIPLSGLAGGTSYYLRITATDSSDVTNPNRTTILEYDPSGIPALTFTTIGVLKTISDVEEGVITDSKAVITFKTDQNAKCFIDFKENSVTEYNDLAGPEDDYSKNHSITLTQLFSKTLYDYKINCADSKDTGIISDNHQFTTSEKGLTQGDFEAGLDKSSPTITGVSVASVSGENAKITWNTDEVSNSVILYEADGADFMLVAGDSTVITDTEKYATTHTVEMKNLIPATKYLFSVMSIDKAGNIAQSAESTLTTKEPSSLSSVKVLSKALGQATITWKTGSPTSSLVEYGLTTAYGQKKEDNSKTKEHSITLPDLTPGETYHFRVKGQDDEGNLFASSDTTFQPKAPPKISDFKIDAITEHGATVTFTTNVSTDAIINYENVDDESDSGFQGRPDYVTKHEVKLKDLTSGKTFSIKLKVRDEDGNETEETFPSFTTTKDEVPPKIDRIKTDAALTQNDKVQSIISWSTDEMATGKILYKEGKNGEEKTFEVNSSPSFSHIGVIIAFKPGTVYYFKVKSEDMVGNVAVSSDYAILTPKQRQNIIQVIVGNFTDIFGWAKF